RTVYGGRNLQWPRRNLYLDPHTTRGVRRDLGTIGSGGLDARPRGHHTARAGRRRATVPALGGQLGCTGAPRRRRRRQCLRAPNLGSESVACCALPAALGCWRSPTAPTASRLLRR